MPFGIDEGEGIEGIRITCVEDSVCFEIRSWACNSWCNTNVLLNDLGREGVKS